MRLHSPFIWCMLCLSLGMLTALPAFAADDDDIDPLMKPYLEAARQQPSLADAPFTIIAWSEEDMVKGAYTHVGWTPRIQGRILGHTKSGDAVLVDLAQGGKVVKSLRAGLKGIDPSTTSYCEDFEISGDSDTDMITTIGDFDVTIKYYSDDDEKTTVLAKRKFTAVRVVYYDTSQNKWKYGYLCDDLLGFSYLFLRSPEDMCNVWIYSWMSLPSSSALKDITYRIEVDGKKIDQPVDFTGSGNHTTVNMLEQEERFYDKAKKDAVTNNYRAYLMVFRPYLIWGPKPEDPHVSGIYFADHPGKWVLKIRVAGQVVRELRFTVLPGGLVAPHPEQDPTKPGFLNLGPYRYFCETYYPNPNTIDERFNPAAILKGTLFGRPWISDEVKNGMLTQLPPKRSGALVFPQPALPAVK